MSRSSLFERARVVQKEVQAEAQVREAERQRQIAEEEQGRQRQRAIFEEKRRCAPWSGLVDGQVIALSERREICYAGETANVYQFHKIIPKAAYKDEHIQARLFGIFVISTAPLYDFMPSVSSDMAAAFGGHYQRSRFRTIASDGIEEAR